MFTLNTKIPICGNILIEKYYNYLKLIFCNRILRCCVNKIGIFALKISHKENSSTF